MSKNPISIKEIEDYLSGELAPEHLAEFEKRLQDDEKMRQEFFNVRDVIEGIQGYAFKQKMKEIHGRLFPRSE